MHLDIGRLESCDERTHTCPAGSAAADGGVGPCVTDQPESGCQTPRGEARTDLTAGLEWGSGDPYSAGGALERP